MLGYNVTVPAHVCAALLARVTENDDVLSTLDIPTTLVHGDLDTSIRLSMAEHHGRIIANASLQISPNIGHAPYLEASVRFNQELLEFATRTR
jgi:non-heme chloroperoxidase